MTSAQIKKSILQEQRELIEQTLHQQHEQKGEDADAGKNQREYKKEPSAAAGREGDRGWYGNSSTGSLGAGVAPQEAASARSSLSVSNRNMDRDRDATAGENSGKVLLPTPPKQGLLPTPSPASDRRPSEGRRREERREERSDALRASQLYNKMAAANSRGPGRSVPRNRRPEVSGYGLAFMSISNCSLASV